MLTYAIYDPLSDQAVAIARVYREQSSCQVVAVAGDAATRRLAAQSGVYSRVVSEESALLEGYELVPSTHSSTSSFISRFPERAPRGFRIAQNEVVQNKVELLEIARKVGVPVPLTVRQHRGLTFPVFYKEEVEQGGGRRGVAYKESDLPAEKDGLIFQEYLPSPGTYAVAFIAKTGTIVAAKQHFERISLPKAGGSAVLVEEFDSVRLSELAEALVSELAFDGWGLAEFKWCERRHDFVLMEINAKLWASIEFTLRNSPEFGRALFGSTPTLPCVNSMVFLHRVRANVVWDTLREMLRGEGATCVVYRSYLLAAFAARASRLRGNLLKVLRRGCPAGNL